MPGYQTPGVYIEERSGPRPIEGVGTAVAAFIGIAPAGPANQPVLITSWQQYVDTFSADEHGRKNPHMPGVYLSHAVAGYFLNGGGRCYVTRVVAPGVPDMPQIVHGTIINDQKKPLFTVASRTVPTEDITIDVTNVESVQPSQTPTNVWKLIVTPIDNRGKPSGADESHELATDKLDAINAESKRITIQPAPGADHLAEKDRKPGSMTFKLSPTTPEEKDSDQSSQAEQKGGDQPPQAEILSSTGKPLYIVTAKDRTGPALSINVRSEQGAAPPATATGHFDLEIKSGDLKETLKGVSLSSHNNVAEVTRRRSKLVVVELCKGLQGNELPTAGQQIVLPAPRLQSLAVQTSHLTGGDDGHSGVAGLKIAEDVTMICCPDLMSAYEAGMIDRSGIKKVQQAMIEHCENIYRRDRIAILDSPPDARMPQEVLAWRNEEVNHDSAFAALYYPWITITGPDDYPLSIPPCGHIAGIYARNDRERGVHKAPANEVIHGVQSVSRLSHEDQAILNPEGINCIRTFTGRGIRVWGARTLSSDPQWTYVNVRRLFNYVEKSIERSMQWVVFEPHNPDLWERVKRDINAFLTSTWRQGMLFGRSPAEAFFVICDETINPEEERNVGRLYVDIGMAAVRPAEFVVFRFQQLTVTGS
jgi:hypothetical protein